MGGGMGLLWVYYCFTMGGGMGGGMVVGLVWVVWLYADARASHAAMIRACL